jgi:hypothetical protein
MNTKDIVQSIGDKITAIDLKLERLLNNIDRQSGAQLEQMKSFLDEIARTMTTKLTGELPRAIELLEKKIDSFDLNLSDSLKIFGDHLLSYEIKLEERMIEEIQGLGRQLIQRLDKQQEEHAQRLENISRSMDNLSSAIAKLYNRQPDLDPERLTQALENLNNLLDKQEQENKSRKGFLRLKKP